MISACHEHRVQLFDLDAMQVVWHGNYVRLFEQARSALFDRLGYNYPQMDTSDYLWPIVDMRVKFLQPATFGQQLRTTATLGEYENCIRIDYVTRETEHEHRVCSGFTIQAAIERHSGEMLYRTPDFLIERIRALL